MGGVTKVVGVVTVFGGVFGAVMIMLVGLDTARFLGGVEGVGGSAAMFLSVSSTVTCGNFSVESDGFVASRLSLLFFPPKRFANPEPAESGPSLSAGVFFLGKVNAPRIRSAGDIRRSSGGGALVVVAGVRVGDSVSVSGSRSEAVGASVDWSAGTVA